MKGNKHNLLFLGVLTTLMIMLIGCTSSPKQLYMIKEDGKCGFIDSLGNKVIEPSYIFAAKFSDGVALVVTDTTQLPELVLKLDYHYINEHGKTVGRKNYTAYIDVLDRLAKKGPNMSSFSYSEGKALFQTHIEPEDDNNNFLSSIRYGYINKKGEVIIPCKYNNGDLFHEGKTMVQETYENAKVNDIHDDLKWKVINEKGESLTDYMFYEKQSFTNNRCLASFLTKRDSSGVQKQIFVLLNENAKIIKTFPYGGEKILVDEYIIDQAGPMTMINISSQALYALDGSEVTPSREMSPAELEVLSQKRGFLFTLDEDLCISYVKGFSEGLCVCTTGGKNADKWFFTDIHWSLYGDRDNEVYVFEDALPFSSGLAAVKMDGKWGYINHDFKIVIPCQYDKAESFNGSLAYVESGFSNLKIRSYINKSGMPVWQDSSFDN